MKPATIHQIKKELIHLSNDELVEHCLKLARFKRDNKELLSYLLFESNEDDFINNLKLELDQQFNVINTSSLFLGKKTIRKVRRYLNRFIKYSGKPETEIQLRMHYCELLQGLGYTFSNSKQMQNIYHAQLKAIDKALGKLHEDLQYDYKAQRESLATWQ